MVSKASEDLPDPESPVMTVRVFRGISILMFSNVCWRAPRTTSFVSPITRKVRPHRRCRHPVGRLGPAESFTIAIRARVGQGRAVGMGEDGEKCWRKTVSDS